MAEKKKRERIISDESYAQIVGYLDGSFELSKSTMDAQEKQALRKKAAKYALQDRGSGPFPHGTVLVRRLNPRAKKVCEYPSTTC